MVLAATMLGCLSSTPPTQGGSGTEVTAGTDTTSADTSSGATTLEPETGTGVLGECDATPLRIATYNINDVGADGTDERIALEAVLHRIDADIVCMQEVYYAGSERLQGLAGGLGYERIFQAETSPAIGGDWTNACIARIPVTLVESYTASELSNDGSANDLGRDILVVRAEPEPGCFVGVFTVHLKAGNQPTDVFRKAVESERLVQAIEKYRITRPEDALVVLGDFNEQITDSGLGTQLTEVPSDLPESYRLGADIEMPLIYHPFERLASLGFSVAEATWEDSGLTATWNETSRLDYVFYGQAILEGAEVYNSCEDNGIDDDPPGGWLPKQGEPLACDTSRAASDHFPVFVDLTLP